MIQCVSGQLLRCLACTVVYHNWRGKRSAPCEESYHVIGCELPQYVPAELNVYCTMHSCLVGLEAIKAAGPRVKGLILSGGPASVYEADAPHLDVSRQP